jgi:hypothetical protein
VGIIGLPQSGKTSYFSAVTGIPVELGSREARIGIVHVPDARLNAIADLVGSAKRTPPELEFVDMIALDTDGGGQSEDFVKRIGNSDACAVVVGGVAASPESVTADLDRVITELTLADLITVENRLERIGKELERGRKELQGERDKLLSLKEILDGGQALRCVPEAEPLVDQFRGLGLLSSRPVLAVINRPQAVAGEIDEPATAHAQAMGVPALCLDASLEHDLLELDEEERPLFMEAEGLEELAAPRTIRACFELLDVVTFYTAGEKETRAIPVSAGTTAWEAAGKVHTDIQKGFQRAEVVGYDAFMAGGGWAGAKAAGKFRLEGRDYPIADGDVVHFRFTS